MEERRKEVRTMYDSISDSIKNIQLKSGTARNYDVTTVDISYSGMGFITTEKVEKDLDIGNLIDVCFTQHKCNLKANVVYVYPIANSKTRIGVIFKIENSIKQYNKILKQCFEAEQ